VKRVDVLCEYFAQSAVIKAASRKRIEFRIATQIYIAAVIAPSVAIRL